jgi:activating signal cointegrator complex subunit 2
LSRKAPRDAIQDEDKQGILSQRRNIYDNDEFDVFSHDVDASRVHIGKKERVPTKGTVAFLDDHSALATLKPLMERYGNEFVESMYDKNVDYEDVYEDEYDDTYDSVNNAVGVNDDDSADELTTRKTFPQFKPQAASSDSGAAEKPRDLFIEDPAKLRQMREEKWAAHEAMRRRGKGGAGAPPAWRAEEGEGGEREKSNPGGRTYDTKGVPKGQGQSAEVLRNRLWKEKHKSATVHHNRKAMSDKKHRI